MALIKCPECKREVSDRAPSCPSCGNPLAATTVEQTGKEWKTLKLIGAALSILGVIVLLGNRQDGLSAFGAAVFVTGVAVFIGAGIAAWWHHG